MLGRRGMRSQFKCNSPNRFLSNTLVVYFARLAPVSGGRRAGKFALLSCVSDRDKFFIRKLRLAAQACAELSIALLVTDKDTRLLRAEHHAAGGPRDTMREGDRIKCVWAFQHPVDLEGRDLFSIPRCERFFVPRRHPGIPGADIFFRAGVDNCADEDDPRLIKLLLCRLGAQTAAGKGGRGDSKRRKGGGDEL